MAIFIKINLTQLHRNSATCSGWTLWSLHERSSPRGSKWGETTYRKHRPKNRWGIISLCYCGISLHTVFLFVYISIFGAGTWLLLWIDSSFSPCPLRLTLLLKLWRRRRMSVCSAGWFIESTKLWTGPNGRGHLSSASWISLGLRSLRLRF